VTFWQIFVRVLVRRPGPALEALYWHLTRRKVRARNRLRVAAIDLPFTYKAWMTRMERDHELARDLERIVSGWARRPQFVVLMHSTADASPERAAHSLRSLERQIYPGWTLVQVPDQSLTGAIAGADGDYVVLLRAGDELAEAALFRFAEALQGDVAPTLLYGDQDERDCAGRRSRPWFKPQWNAEMFLAMDFLAAAVAIDLDLARDVSAGIDPLHVDDLLLAATAAAGDGIAHVPHILCHVDAANADKAASRLQAVSRHLKTTRAHATPGPFNTVKVEWPLPSELPLVSIIVPTRDRLELLRPCVESVLGSTSYEPFELLIVDNGSTDPAALAYLADVANRPRVRVVRYDRPYNYSAINNFAAAQATGSYLCLLNNDTEVVTPEWLTEMMRYAVRDEIGAVGAKLLYDDGTIQHAGVVVGLGDAAGHAHRFLPSNDPGYFCQPHVAQYVTAVTAACLVVEKRKFDAIGGLDEQDLAVAYNDVDLCLKLQSAGWRNVYVPHAVLLHHESKSRGSDSSPENRDRYGGELRVLQERWGTKTFQDPLHNPNLDRYSETFVIRV
jgi:GT2 family glycosyltransferase